MAFTTVNGASGDGAPERLLFADREFYIASDVPLGERLDCARQIAEYGGRVTKSPTAETTILARSGSRDKVVLEFGAVHAYDPQLIEDMIVFEDSFKATEADSARPLQQQQGLFTSSTADGVVGQYSQTEVEVADVLISTSTSTSLGVPQDRSGGGQESRPGQAKKRRRTLEPTISNANSFMISTDDAQTETAQSPESSADESDDPEPRLHLKRKHMDLSNTTSSSTTPSAPPRKLRKVESEESGLITAAAQKVLQTQPPHPSLFAPTGLAAVPPRLQKKRHQRRVSKRRQFSARSTPGASSGSERIFEKYEALKKTQEESMAEAAVKDVESERQSVETEEMEEMESQSVEEEKEGERDEEKEDEEVVVPDSEAENYLDASDHEASEEKDEEKEVVFPDSDPDDYLDASDHEDTGEKYEEREVVVPDSDPEDYLDASDHEASNEPKASQISEENDRDETAVPEDTEQQLAEQPTEQDKAVAVEETTEAELEFEPYPVFNNGATGDFLLPSGRVEVYGESAEKIEAEREKLRVLILRWTRLYYPREDEDGEEEDDEEDEEDEEEDEEVTRKRLLSPAYFLGILHRTSFDADLAETIIQRLSNGTYTRFPDSLPGAFTVADDEDLKKAYELGDEDAKVRIEERHGPRLAMKRRAYWDDFMRVYGGL